MSGSQPRPDLSSAAISDLASTLTADATFSIWLGNLEGDVAFERDADEPHDAASTMKLAMTLAAYRLADAGRLDLNRQVRITDTFASASDGSAFTPDRDDDSDEEPWQRAGEDVALRWLCYRAIVRSSNLATNVVLAEIGTDIVNETLTALGANDSLVARGMDDQAARSQGIANLVTARDLATTLRAVSNETAATPAACREVLGVLAAQQINNAIPKGLPPGVGVAHKSGWNDGVEHDAAIVYPLTRPPYVLVVCTTSTLASRDALALIGKISAAAWNDLGDA